MVDDVCNWLSTWRDRVPYRLHPTYKACTHTHTHSVCLHWLRIPEHIEYKIALLTYKVMNGMAPWYLGPFVRVAYLPGWRALRSAVTNRLTVPAVKLSSIGSRAFSVSGPHTWNQLPEEFTPEASLSTFQCHLNTFLFRKSFPDIIADWHFTGPCGKLNYLGHSKKFWLIDWLIENQNKPAFVAWITAAGLSDFRSSCWGFCVRCRWKIGGRRRRTNH